MQQHRSPLCPRLEPGNFLFCFCFLSDYSNARLPVLGVDSLFYPKTNATLMQTFCQCALGLPGRSQCKRGPAGPFRGLFWCLGHCDCANDNQPRPTVGESTSHKSARSLSADRVQQPAWSGASHSGRVLCHPGVCSPALLQYLQ